MNPRNLIALAIKASLPSCGSRQGGEAEMGKKRQQIIR